MAMDARHLGELADKASDLVRSEGKRPPLPMPGEDIGELLADGAPIVAIGQIRRTVERARHALDDFAPEDARRGSPAAEGRAWNGAMNELDDAANDLQAMEDVALDTADGLPADGDGRTFGPDIIGMMEAASIGAKAHILNDLRVDREGGWGSLDDLVEIVPAALMQAPVEQRGQILVGALRKMLLSPGQEATA